MRVELIGHCKPCMVIFTYTFDARTADDIRTHPSEAFVSVHRVMLEYYTHFEIPCALAAVPDR